jgi:RNA polymerase sigma-70 factor (ECF subfamily)
MNHDFRADEVPELLLAQARAGEAAALGRLLELYRNYLRLQARALIGAGLRVRLDPSDLVQETFLEAHRDFPRFVGQSEGEVLAWLRQILVRNLADQLKRHQAHGRDYRRQQSLEAKLERSSEDVEQALAAGLSTPSARAAKRELTVLLADALAALPPDYREVIVLRQLEHLKFEEIAVRLGRSCGAVRMLWMRALEKLHRLLEERP